MTLCNHLQGVGYKNELEVAEKAARTFYMTHYQQTTSIISNTATNVYSLHKSVGKYAPETQLNKYTFELN